MGDSNASHRLLQTLEQLLQIPTSDLQTTLLQSVDLIAHALGAEKVDAFIHDPARDSLVALSSSNQPLSALQRKLGLDVLQVANGGRVVGVYKTGKPFITGRLSEDAEELRGIKEGLGIESKIGVPLEMDGVRRGMVMVASRKRDAFTAADLAYAETIVRWVGVLAHRAELGEEMRRNAVERSRLAGAEELVTVVAHDLRNYLAPIELRVDLLRRQAGRDRLPEARRELDQLANSVARLRALVSDLLDVAKLEHGVFSVKPGAVDLAALLRDSARVLSTPGIRIDVRVQSAGKIVAIADEARLRQCLDNLIANAVQQSPEGATVTVILATQTHSSGECARVEVIDEGPGVPPEMASRIFERMATGKGGSGGLGLGLFLAKRIAALHGGDLVVESRPGKGARFHLTIPCRLEQADATGTRNPVLAEVARRDR